MKKLTRVSGALAGVVCLIALSIFTETRVWAQPTLEWNHVSIQGRNVRLLATASGSVKKWCLTVDGTPVKTDVVGTRYQDGELFGTPFDARTGCWEASTGVRLFAAFYVPMSSVPSGLRVFGLTVTDTTGASTSITTTVEVVHTPPVIQWDWLKFSNGKSTSIDSGVISYGFSTQDPVSKWCLLIDSGVQTQNLARSRYADYEIFDSDYDPLTGCWSKSNGQVLFSGSFIVPTHTIPNGPHSIRLTATDVYGVSSTIETSFVSRNIVSVSDIAISTFQRPYPATSSTVQVSATAGNARSYEIRVGKSSKVLKIVKKGALSEFGQINVSLGNHKSRSTLFVRVTVKGINGSKSSPIKKLVIPPALPSPVSLTLPVVPLPKLNLFIPGLTPQKNLPRIVSQACEVRSSGLSSDWKGRSFSWTIWGILENGTKTIVRSGSAWEYPTSTFDAIPSVCR
jgi:hypothetical protein